MNAGIANALRRALVVARKEIIDSLRDRRTLLVSTLTAAAAGPIFIVLIFNLIASQADRARELKLPALGMERAPAVAMFLERNQVTLSVAPADYEAKLRSGDLDVVLVVDDAFATDVAEGRPGTVRIVSDRSRDRAQSSIRQAENLLRAYNRLWGGQRLLLRGIATSVGNPLNIEDVDLATPQQSGAIILFLVAFYGLFASVMGGLAVALDATAGERERQSLEPLLMTPARPLELVVGKWLAVSLFNASVVLITLAGFYLTLSFAPLPQVGVPFQFGARELARFLVVLLPMILLIPAVLLFVGSRGRTFKEAQANVSVLLFVVLITLAGFYLTLSFAPLPQVGVPFQFGARELARFLVVLLPMILLIPAVLLFVGSRGRTFKEAQANVSVLLFVVSLVPAAQMFLQQKEPEWLVLVPISGQYTLLKYALRGEPLLFGQLALSYVVPAILAAAALYATSRLLSRESVLAGK